jgi:hypothetical protein
MCRQSFFCLVVAACDFGGSQPPPQPEPEPPLCSKAGFRYTFSSSSDLATPMVAGGAYTYITACVGPEQPEIADVSVSSPAVAVADKPTTPGRFVTFGVESGVAGDTDLTLLDAAGNELARTTLHVADATELAVDRGWGTDPAPTLLDGGVSVLHVTTLRGADTLVGLGAVHFAFDGAVESTSYDNSLSGAYGDVVYFRAHAGGGTITASCPGASVQVPIAVVDASALTELRASTSSIYIAAGQEGAVRIGAFAGATPVYDVRCAWGSHPALYPQPDRWSNYGGLGSDAGYWYSITGPHGSYALTCAVPGGLSTNLSVTIY